jgi:hypothetical protein
MAATKMVAAADRSNGEYESQSFRQPALVAGFFMRGRMGGLIGGTLTESKMRFRFLAGLLCGIALGICGMLVVYRIVSQDQRKRPTIPPNAERREFNGREYYIIPLATRL